MNEFGLLAYERGDLAVCPYADQAVGWESDPFFQKHLSVLRQEFGVDGLIYLSRENKIIYFFTSPSQVESEEFLQIFFSKTHPELQRDKIRKLLGTTLLFRGKEAVEYLYRDVISNQDPHSFIHSFQATMNNSARNEMISLDLEVVCHDMMAFVDSIAGKNVSGNIKSIESPALIEDIEDRLHLLARTLRNRNVLISLKKAPEAIHAAKKKAVETVFKKELEDLDEKSRDLMLRMLDYVEKESAKLPLEQAILHFPSGNKTV